MRTRFSRMAMLGMFGFAFCATVPSAHAGLELKLFDGTNTTIIDDGGVGDFDAAVDDSISWKGNFGSLCNNAANIAANCWQLNISTAFDVNPVAPGGPLILDLNVALKKSPAFASGGPKTLTITVSYDGYFPSASAFDFGPSTNFTGSKMSATAAAFTGTGLYGNNHSLGSFAFNTPGCTPNLTTCFGPGAYSGNQNTTYFAQAPYSATIAAGWTAYAGNSGGGGSMDMQLAATNAPVPEPAVVTLLGGVLLLTAGALRRKSRVS